MIELQKIILAFLGYIVLPPLAGLIVARKRIFQTITFGMLVGFLVLRPSYITFNLESIEWYRGHTKGFEYSLMEVLALVLIFSCIVRQVKDVRLFPPGTLLYLFSVLLACISFVSSYNPLFSSMALFKFSKVILLFVAGYNYLQEEKDFRFYLRTMAVILFVHMLVGVSDRYMNGTYRVRGWFEHENSMAMWSYVCGLPLLAAALARQTTWRESLLYFVGYGSSGLMVVLSLSRASIAIFVVGSLAIAGLLFLRHPTWKRVVLIGTMALVGGVVLLAASDSIISRFANAGDGSEAGDLRWILNQMSSAMVADHPTGVGWNNYGVLNSRPYVPYSQMLEVWEANRVGYEADIKSFYSNPLTESLYWCVLAEVGYAGLIGYLLFLVVTYFRLIHAMVVLRGTFLGTVLIGFAIMLSMAYLHSSVERILTQTKNLATWLLILGMLAKVKVWSEEVERDQPIAGLFYELRQFSKWIMCDVLVGRGPRKPVSGQVASSRG